MKIAILNGSPRKENTAAMVDAFKAGAEEAGNEVCVLHVGRMKINGCLGCEYCHGKGEPLNAGKIAELTGMDRKVVDKAMAVMKKDGSIVSPIRCKWEPAEK
ncbi:MAG: flavodoxin family protein [Oribacterium sp.]|nr:flavodoxin family protein [Oribacterium sp.]